MEYVGLRICFGIMALICIALALGFQFGISFVKVEANIVVDEKSKNFCRTTVLTNTKNSSLWANINDYKVKLTYKYNNKEYTKDMTLSTNLCKKITNFTIPKKTIDLHIYRNNPQKIYNFSTGHYVLVALFSLFGLLFLLGVFFPKFIVDIIQTFT